MLHIPRRFTSGVKIGRTVVPGSRRFSQPVRTGKPDPGRVNPTTDEVRTDAPTGSTTASHRSDVSSIRWNSFDAEEFFDRETAALVQSLFKVKSTLLPRFDGPLTLLNESGVSPESAMKLLSLLDDRIKLNDLAQAVLTEARDLDGDIGKSVRLKVPSHHQYSIVSQVHEAASFADRFLTTSPCQAKIEALVSCFPAGGKLDGQAFLGRSGIVLPSHYRDVDLGDVMASYCMMTTTKWHALDGFLMWMLVHHKPSREFCYFAYGSGAHRLRSVDELNPVLGGAMMSTMTSQLAVVLNGRFDLAGKTPEQILDFVRKADPELARRCEQLTLLDRGAVPIAAYRELMGGNTVAKPETE